MKHYLTVYGEDDLLCEAGPLSSEAVEMIKAAIGGFADDDPKGVYSYHLGTCGLHVYLEPFRDHPGERV